MTKWLNVCRMGLFACLLGVSAVGAPLPEGQASEEGGDERPSFLEAISADAEYTGEVLSNVRGGIRRGSEYLGMFTVSLAVDGNRAFPWKGGHFQFTAHHTHGGSISERVGDIQGLSNIEADREFRVFESWYEQTLWRGRLSLLAGLYDLNSEFDSIETAQLFLDSSHGIGPDFSLSGTSGPSIFPVTRPAFRAYYQPRQSLRLSVVWADGPTGPEDLPQLTDGSMAVTEIGFTPSHLPLRGALGLWSYSQAGRFERIHGCYAYVEGTAWHSSSGRDQVSLFLRVGDSFRRISPVSNYVGTGVVWRRDPTGQALGLALAVARPAETPGEAIVSRQSEAVIEFTYQFPVRKRLWLQPNLQYVIHPGMGAKSPANALVLGGRFTVEF